MKETGPLAGGLPPGLPLPPRHVLDHNYAISKNWGKFFSVSVVEISTHGRIYGDTGIGVPKGRHGGPIRNKSVGILTIYQCVY